MDANLFGPPTPPRCASSLIGSRPGLDTGSSCHRCQAPALVRATCGLAWRSRNSARKSLASKPWSAPKGAGSCVGNSRAWPRPPAARHRLTLPSARRRQPARCDSPSEDDRGSGDAPPCSAFAAAPPSAEPPHRRSGGGIWLAPCRLAHMAASSPALQWPVGLSRPSGYRSRRCWLPGSASCHGTGCALRRTSPRRSGRAHTTCSPCRSHRDASRPRGRCRPG